MAFLTDAACLQKLADVLQAASTSALPAQWASTILPDCHVWAYQELLTALASRGFTAVQIAAWDRGAEFEGDLTLYRALSRGGSLQNLDDKFINTFDRRDDLHGNPSKNITAVSVLNGGVWQAPAGGVGLPSHGVEATGSDIFVWPGTGDPPFPPGELGETARV